MVSPVACSPWRAFTLSAVSMGTEGNTLRLFVALLIPDAVKAALAKAQGELRAVLPDAAVGWTRPEQFHLTLKFLGSVDTGRVDSLTASLKEACSKFSAMKIESSSAGFFPNIRRPRVIWVGLNAQGDILSSLHEQTEAACAEFTAEKPENRFHAHVTLGRVKHAGRAEIEAMEDWARSHENRSFGSWQANEVVLVQSQLSSKGAVHSTLRSFPFEM